MSNKSKSSLKTQAASSGKIKRKRLRKRLILAFLSLITLILLRLAWHTLIQLPINSQKPIDGILVLGGSINREIYVSEIAKLDPELPILISRGSEPPCIFSIFEAQNAPMTQVLLENCAHSTFDNFLFSVPILAQKKVHHVRVITSPTHLPRAKYLAQIHLGAQGIAVKVDTADEKGVPGNRESKTKTILDVTRSLMWVMPAQIIKIPCFSVVSLSQVHPSTWEQKAYRCERQKRLKLKPHVLKVPLEKKV